MNVKQRPGPAKDILRAVMRRWVRSPLAKVTKGLYRRKIRAFDVLNREVEFRATIKTRFSEAQTVHDRNALYAYVNGPVLQNVPIDYLEFGVWRGESLRKWAEINTRPESRLYGFDSFEGLPESWNSVFAKGAFGTAGEAPMMEDGRVRFVKGLFQESLRRFLREYEPSNRLVVHIDSDIYSAALFVLASLDGFLKPGSVIVFDEFRDVENEYLAFSDYVHSFYREWHVTAHTDDYWHVAVVMDG